MKNLVLDWYNAKYVGGNIEMVMLCCCTTALLLFLWIGTYGACEITDNALERTVPTAKPRVVMVFWARWTSSCTARPTRSLERRSIPVWRGTWPAWLLHLWYAEKVVDMSRYRILTTFLFHTHAIHTNWEQKRYLSTSIRSHNCDAFGFATFNRIALT